MIFFLFNACLAYLIGSLPLSLWLTAFHQLPDPRTYGSCNIGATNVGRQRCSMGIAVFLLDASKVWLTLAVARYGNVQAEALVALWSLVILGQTRSIFLKFQGGKGVSCFVGGLLALYPQWLFMCLVPSLIVGILTTRMWQASVCGALLFALLSVHSLPWNTLLLIHLSIAFWIAHMHQPNYEADKSNWLKIFHSL